MVGPANAEIIECATYTFAKNNVPRPALQNKLMIFFLDCAKWFYARPLKILSRMHTDKYMYMLLSQFILLNVWQKLKIKLQKKLNAILT